MNLKNKIFRAIFFKKRFESIAHLLLEIEEPVVFELHMEELVKKLFEQLRNETTNVLPRE